MAEDPKERVDRELIELLNEIRVALPGVQVLFAFLLILPFQQGFERITDLERIVFFGSLLMTAAGSALLIAPSSIHRLRFRSGPEEKERMLFTSNRLLIGGLVFVLLGIVGSVFLVADVLFGNVVAALVAAGTALWFGWFWYGLPLMGRRAAGRDEGESQADR